MGATQSKAEMVRERLDEIAYHRMNGETWPTIAAFLSVLGIQVSGDEIRAYWGRFAGGKHPAEFLVERSAARAEEAERRLVVAEEKLRRLEGDLAAWMAAGTRIAVAHRARSNEAMMTEIELISAWYDRQQK